MMTEEQYLVPAVVSAGRMLSILADRPSAPMSQSELAQDADMSKSSAHNLLRTLEHLGFVHRDVKTRQYVLGQALVALGRAASQHHQLLDSAEDAATALAGEHGLEFAVAQRVGDEVEIVFAAPPPTGIYISAMLGTKLGLLDGAIGRCMLAQMSDLDMEKFVRSQLLVATTPSTITDPDEVIARVRRTRELGYGTAAGELWELHAVVAPIYDAAGDMGFALMALGFPGQLPVDEMESLGAHLRSIADGIGHPSSASYHSTEVAS